MIMADSREVRTIRADRRREFGFPQIVSPVHLSGSSRSPTPTISRFDLLLHEKISLVKNAQEGLQQSLALLQKAYSKEEQESGKVQVHSLLQRAEGLVVSLQIIMQIWKEIAYIQKEITMARKAQRKTADLHCRLLWLEQRLERLLLAQRRARPAARGRRAAPPRPLENIREPTESFATSGDQLHPTQPAYHRGNRMAAASYHPTTMSSVTGDVESSLRPSPREISSTSPSSDLSRHSNVGKQRMVLRTSVESPVYSKSESQSYSKKSVSMRDSDVWHSESEANWTMVEAFSNPLNKDITQSQLLSSADEQSHADIRGGSQHPLIGEVQITQDVTPTNGNGRVSHSLSQNDAHSPVLVEEGDSLKMSTYGFEAPRPAEVFGPCSWNSLCLAVNTNLVGKAPDQEQTTDDLASLLQAGLESICTEIDNLKSLVQAAALAATKPGQSVPSTSCGKRRSSIYHSTAKQSSDSPRSMQTTSKNLPSSGTNLKLPSLHDIPSSVTVSPSRKVYGRKARPCLYPRSSITWYPQDLHSQLKSPGNESKEEPYTNTVATPLQTRSSPKRRKSVMRSAKNKAAEEEDIFNKTKFQTQHIQSLLEKVDSPQSEARTDAIHALGVLTSSNFQAQQKVHEKMLHDINPMVRYEALKSLIHIGILDSEVLKCSTAYLLKCSCELQLDLLKCLCSKNCLTRFAEAKEAPVVAGLSGVLVCLLGDPKDQSKVSLLAAVLLSYLKLEEERCTRRLKAALEHQDPQYQSMALACLVLCWHCHTSAIICQAVNQMQKLSSWQLRLAAAEAMKAIGSQLLMAEIRGQNIFDILLDRLINEPVQVVKVAIREILTELDLGKKAQTLLLGRLENPSEVKRAEAVIALGAFELKSHKTIHLLLECLELDPSTYVRVQVVRLLGQVKSHNPTVMQCLLEKSRGSGSDVMSRYCLSALQK